MLIALSHRDLGIVIQYMSTETWQIHIVISLPLKSMFVWGWWKEIKLMLDTV